MEMSRSHHWDQTCCGSIKVKVAYEIFPLTGLPWSTLAVGDEHQERHHAKSTWDLMLTQSWNNKTINFTDWVAY